MQLLERDQGGGLEEGGRCERAVGEHQLLNCPQGLCGNKGLRGIGEVMTDQLRQCCEAGEVEPEGLIIPRFSRRPTPKMEFWQSFVYYAQHAWIRTIIKLH